MRLKSIRTIIVISLLVLVFMSQSLGSGFVHAEGPSIVDGDGTVVLKRGMGLGGWLVPEGYMLQFPGVGSPTAIRNQIIEVAGIEGAEEFYEAYEANYVTREDMMMLGEWGFDHIRLPFHYQQFSPSPGVWNEKGFTIVDSMIAWCRSADMLLVLDMHCAPGAQNHGPISDSDGTARLWLEKSHQDHAVDIWREIASRYVNEELIAGYDLLNEPVLPQGVSSQQFRDLYVRMVNRIREVDQNHLVFIEGNWYATDFTGLTPPFDSNMAYSFHKYWSTNDQNSIHGYVKMRSDFNVPLWMSESGENSNTWFRDATQLLEDNDIGWCWWTHKKYDTVTSPLSATMPEAMDIVMEYFNDPASRVKPSQAYARAALMAMADALKTEACESRPGVIPALFDTDYTSVLKPVKTNILPGYLWAADYDLGAQGIAYSDNDYENNHWDAYTPWNRGYQYRNDGVDLQYLDNSNIPNVGWIEDGEWLIYTTTFAHDGVFNVGFEISNTDLDGELEYYFDGTSMGRILIPDTGGGTLWQTVFLENQLIYAGVHQIKIKVIKGGFNFRRINVEVDEGMTEEMFPVRFELDPNYPNPFNDQTTIPIQINRSDNLELHIIDLKGREIRSYDLSGRLKGPTSIIWDGHNSGGFAVPSGIYLCQLKAGVSVETVRMLLLK